MRSSRGYWLSSKSRFASGAGVSLAVLATLLFAAPGPAAPLPDGPPVSLVARDQPIAGFLRDLFGQSGRPVILSGNLSGTVNGDFKGPTSAVFRDIARAFNLISYFDGAAVYVYPATEVQTRTLPLSPPAAARVARTASSLGLTDAQNSVRVAGDGVLVASGAPRFVEQVAGLARDGGSERGSAGITPGGTGSIYTAIEPRPVPLEFRVFYLRYARAEDITVAAGGRELSIPGIASILRSLVLDDRGQGQLAYGSRTIRQSAARVGGTGLAAVAPDGSQSSVLNLPPQLAALPVLGAEGSVSQTVTGEIVRIEANPAMNAVIVRDAPQRMASYEQLIRAIDVEPQLVEVEATIIDINTQKLRQLGINWRVSSGGFSALFGNGSDSDLRLLPNGQTLQGNTLNITPQARGLSLSSIIGSQNELISRISALEAQGAARVVSRPQVMTLSNVEAVFDRTRTFYVRVAGRQNVDLFNVVAGTTLRINPHVFRDQNQTRIRMLVSIEDGQLSNDAVDGIPIVDRSSVNTQAVILEGESLLLGGLTVDSDSDQVDKIPLLGDIPVVGALFRTKTKQRGRFERLFLITPRLASLTPRVTGGVSPGLQTPTTPAGAPGR